MDSPDISQSPQQPQQTPAESSATKAPKAPRKYVVVTEGQYLAVLPAARGSSVRLVDTSAEAMHFNSIEEAYEAGQRIRQGFYIAHI